MDVLTHLQAGSIVSYLVAFAFPAVDAIFPVLPGETLIVTLGVASVGSSDPRNGLLVACAALGAFTGENLLYWLGMRFEPYVQRRFFSKGKGPQTRRWAERSLTRFGIPLIVMAQFLPGGRTAMMLCCGLVRFDRRRFLIGAGLSSVIWALYLFFLGRLGGQFFEGKPWIGIVISLAITVVIASVVELVHLIAARRRKRTKGG